MNEKPKGDVGVIVGRFQVPNLHIAHKELIQSVIDRHVKVLIVLGLSPIKTTKENPLDLEMRRQVIWKDFPNVSISYVKDMASDKVWSSKLDEVINDNLLPSQSAVLYGSRESFLPFYKGKYPIVELEPKRFISGSEIRTAITKKVMASEEFRAGVIWATGNQYPVCYPTVDVAIINPTNQEILLARKPNEMNYRFIGGFADPKTTSYEEDVRREVAEEAHIEIDNIRYISSILIDDWRYRRENSKIKTLFFCANYIYGSPRADDDIAEVRFFKLKELQPDMLVVEHHPLLTTFKQYISKL